MPPTTRNATLILVIVTVLWGLSFPLMKVWQTTAEQIQVGSVVSASSSPVPTSAKDANVDLPIGALLSASTLIAIRMLLAAGILAACQPRLVSQPQWREHGYGAVLGVIFIAGFIF